MSKPTPISGFLEWLPAQRYTEQLVLDIIREVFELHGFEPINTRAVEPVERLTGKGGDADKEIYAVSRLAADEADKAEPGLGLHFDLTVPFSRYVIENAGKLTFPFRRYQIQRVYRGERQQRLLGRGLGQVEDHGLHPGVVAVGDVLDRDVVADVHRGAPKDLAQLGVRLAELELVLIAPDRTLVPCDARPLAVEPQQDTRTQ